MNATLVISHRGRFNRNGTRENTLEAFERAHAMGVDGIETDVRLTADGVAVSYHDRLLPDGRPLAMVEYADLEPSLGYSVPRIEDCVASWDVLWNLEIKTPLAVGALASIVASRLADRRFLITSSHHDIIGISARHIPVDHGLLVTKRPRDPQSQLIGRWRSSPRVRTIVWQYELFDQAFVREPDAAALKHIVFGPDSRWEHAQCLAWGVEAIITDNPGCLLEGRRRPPAA